MVKKLKEGWNKLKKNSVIKSIVIMILAFFLMWGIFLIIVKFVFGPFWKSINWIG